MSACPVDEGVAHQQPHGDQQVAGQAQHCQLVQHFCVVGGFEIRAVSVVPTRGEDVDEARHPNGKHPWSILLLPSVVVLELVAEGEVDDKHCHQEHHCLGVEVDPQEGEGEDPDDHGEQRQEDAGHHIPEVWGKLKIGEDDLSVCLEPGGRSVSDVSSLAVNYLKQAVGAFKHHCQTSPAGLPGGGGG